ncbi:MAG: cob(I)yrinic acid a,c-diamide adenosyltransferase [bacterium]
MTRIYTKTGDKGETSLFNGKRVSKANELIELVGELDLLNSYLGLIASQSSRSKSISKDILDIQSTIFCIGSEVAYPAKHGALDLTKQTLELETKIDKMEKTNSPLKNFILPGGSELASNIHIARSVTRSIERSFIRSSKTYKNTCVNIFLNRLSDYLFVLARHTNLKKGIKDTIWKAPINN